VADYEHETVVSIMNALFRGSVVPQGGFVAGSEAKFAIREHTGRKPDLSVYLPGKRVPPRHGPIRVPPDIVFEVVTSARVDVIRDRVEKPRDYAMFGVRWYWLITPLQRTLEILELDEDRRYVLALAAAKGCVTLPGCGDLVLDLDALWTELDRLGPLRQCRGHIAPTRGR
jgi:Uma2 family endonuclease